MPVNPAEIRVFEMSLMDPYFDYCGGISQHVKHQYGSLMNSCISRASPDKNDFTAIVVDSGALIGELCTPFLNSGRSNRETSIPVINDDRLEASIANGVGYIGGGSESEVYQNGMIVSDLCNMGKIRLLLSTFAIRNYPITGIKTMYLSGIPQDEYKKPDINKIAQIINKVGGQSQVGNICTIYVGKSEYIPLVMKAFQLTPEEYNYVNPYEGGIVKGIAKDLFKAIFKK